ncbi:MAG: ankyrin repeat domain-containing protein [Candidatus Dependentiae bacterium]|nr:ankyrin repeat domain-containing protein [Candidatus Dependentiae bacterium]
MSLKTSSRFYFFSFVSSVIFASDADLKYFQMLQDSKRQNDLFESQWREKIDFSNPDETIVLSSGLKTTALIMAAQRQDVFLVRKLLNAKANPNLSNDSFSPLSHAVMYRDNQAVSEIVQLLLDANADPSLRDFGGLTPLHYACCKATSYPKTVRKLLEAGSDWLLFAAGCGTPFDIIFSKDGRQFQEKLDLFQKIQMFISNDRYKKLQKSKSGRAVINAFWEYVDGSSTSLSEMVDQNQRIARRYFTPEAIQKLSISSELVGLIPKDRASFAAQVMEERENSSPR